MSSKKKPNDTAVSSETATPYGTAAAIGEPLTPEEHVDRVGKVESKVPGRMRVRLRHNLRTSKR